MITAAQKKNNDLNDRFLVACNYSWKPDMMIQLNHHWILTQDTLVGQLITKDTVYGIWNTMEQVCVHNLGMGHHGYVSTAGGAQL